MALPPRELPMSTTLSRPVSLRTSATLRASSAICSAVEERSGCGLASSLRASGYGKSMACSNFLS